MRKLTRHQINDVNQGLEICAEEDSSSPGGGCHVYHVEIPNVGVMPIRYQHGPVAEFGINGITDEALLTIIIDRLERFLAGPMPTRETAIAKTKCEEALMWLQERTRDRQRREVEGTYGK